MDLPKQNKCSIMTLQSCSRTVLSTAEYVDYCAFTVYLFYIHINKSIRQPLNLNVLLRKEARRDESDASFITRAVQVIGGNVTVVQGGTAVFPCLLTDSTEILSQISWQRRTRLIKPDTNFYTILSNGGPQYFNDGRFSFIGNFLEKNGSLQLSNVTLSDEGTYSCIYTLFPSGNYKTEIPLNVLVPPVTKVEDHFLTVGDNEVALASCTASSSWPPAKVDWHLGNLSDFKFRIAHKSTENTDGTTTTISTLFGVPTRDLHNHSVQCVIMSPALPVMTLSLTIQIHFSPSEVNINERSKNSFECVSEANPKANFTWSRPGQVWPEAALRVDGAVLQILRPTPELNGIFQCEAFNTYGTKQGHLYLHLCGEGTCTAGWTLFSLLLFVNAAVAAMWYYKSEKKCVFPCLRTREFEAPTGDAELTQNRSQTTQSKEASAPESELLRSEAQESEAGSSNSS